MYEIRIVKTKPMKVCESGESITKPDDVFKMIEPIKNHSQEHFICITLNGAGSVIQSRIITIGLLNHSLVHPRETFRGAILDNAASIIIAHNHPSGQLEPSNQDLAITKQMIEAGSILGINVIDHIIVGSTGYLSLKERGLM
jgi:DNA repair protein RadC